MIDRCNARIAQCTPLETEAERCTKLNADFAQNLDTLSQISLKEVSQWMKYHS